MLLQVANLVSWGPKTFFKMINIIEYSSSDSFDSSKKPLLFQDNKNYDKYAIMSHPAPPPSPPARSESPLTLLLGSKVAMLDNH